MKQLYIRELRIFSAATSVNIIPLGPKLEKRKRGITL